MPLNLPKISKKPANRENNNTDFLDTFGVRITPSFLEFKSAFEGKTYKQSLSIRNISTSKVVVRITSPTSYAFEVKPVRCHNLSPGLCLVKNVSYNFTYQTCRSCILPIYINDNRYDYQLIATSSSPKLEFQPKSVEFSSIDVGCSSPIRNLLLKNNGNKSIRFYIDNATTPEYTVITDPFRGVLHPNQCVSVNVRIIPNKEGALVIDLWVKADDNYMIQMTADVIRARLEVISDCPATTFTLIDFPVTYTGLMSSQLIYVRNYSAFGAMFCLTGELNNTVMSIEECRNMQVAFKYFTVDPSSGMLQSRELKSIQFKFHPTKVPPGEKEEKFYFAVINICRIKSKYLTAADFKKIPKSDSCSLGASRSSWTSYGTAYDADMDTSHFLSASSIELDEIVKPVEEPTCLKFYLHGIAEKPTVSVIPDEIILNDLQVGRRETRVLELRNDSYRLPIIFSYKKVAFIDLNSARIYVKPCSSIEVAVYITPHNMGMIATKIRFDLVFHDYPKTDDNYKVIGKVIVPVKFEAKSATKIVLPQINAGITSNYIKESGKFCDNLKFNTRVERPRMAVIAAPLVSKSSSALMALPNDTQTSLRPWRKNKCKTLFTRIPRYVAPLDTDYELTVFDRQVKADVSSYYTNYMRKIAKRIRPGVCSNQSFSDHDIACVKMVDIDANTLHLVRSADGSHTVCVPMHLTPTAISNIVVDPLLVNIGPMAPHNNQEFKINVKNNNSDAISVYITSEKSNVIFSDSDRRIINGNKEISFCAVYISSAIGYYTTELRLIFNHCASVVVNVLANVCPTILKLKSDIIAFDDQRTNKFLEINNPLSTDAFFTWSLKCNNFSIEPVEGYVRGNESLLCYVQYFPDREGSKMVDAELSTGNIYTQQLRLTAQLTSNKLFFQTTEIHYKNIPLNIPVLQKALIKNNSHTPQHFSLVENNLKDYVGVFPSGGVVYPNSYVVLLITVQLTACVHFSTDLKFAVNRSDFLKLTLSGNVVYPNVVIIPEILNFKKIPASTTAMMKFTVANKSDATAMISFEMSMYPDFSITETDKNWDLETVDTIKLEKCESIQLYARFAPSAMSSYQFQLPMIVNDILGKVVNEMTSKQVSFYLVDNIPDSTAIPIPEMLTTAIIQCQASERIIHLSKTLINLSYVPPPNKCIPEYELKICNDQAETAEELCIRLDDVAHPFYLTHLKGKEITQRSTTIICNLLAKEKVFFKVSFRPDRVGIYKTLLPVYVRSDKSGVPHNYLHVMGVFPLPTITYTDSVIYFKSLPVKIQAITTKKLVFENHFESCIIQCTSVLAELEIEVCERVAVDSNTQDIWIKVRLQPQRPLREHFTVSISCSCGATCNIPCYIAIENSFFTNYALVYACVLNQFSNLETTRGSLTTMQTVSQSSLIEEARNVTEDYDLSGFFTSYPLFPEKNDEIYEFMESCVAIMENWIYMQAFNGCRFFKLPEGINYSEISTTNNSKGKSNLWIPPLVQILINMVGTQIEQYFDLKPAPNDELERCHYLYGIYKKAVNFLKDLGARFTCVFPEYMMPYSMHVTYVNQPYKEDDEDDVMTVPDLPHFYRFAKQCWLDVAMQMFKVLVVPGLLRPLENLPPAFDREDSPHYKFRNTIKNVSKNNHLFSSTELLVLFWLEFHYNDVRKTYWANNPHLELREVANFADNMEDGFIYAAVTLTYCPYLEDHFKKLCPYPGSTEELLHNNIKVIQSWDILNLALGVTVTDLLNVHPLRTLMVAMYLFEVLPNMTPAEELQFKVGLSQQQKQTLTIKNNNDFVVAYKAALFGDEDQCFEIKKTLYVIQPNMKCKIDINYWAKFAKISQCTLILSGECKGYRYVKSKVVTLVGEPDVMYVTMELKLSFELYKVCQHKLIIAAPYAVPTTYKVQYSPSLTTIEDIHNALDRYSVTPFSIPRLIPLETSVDFNDAGEGNLTVCTMAITTALMNCWIFFRNSKVGDFTIAILTQPKPISKAELLKVVLPNSFGNQEKGIDKKNSGIFLEIPCRNRMFWKSVVEMLFCLYTTDLDFWKRNVSTTTGMHILQSLISFATAPGSAACGSSHFDVIVMDKNCNVLMPSTIDIEDSCASDTVKVPLRFLDKKNPQSFSIVLKSPTLFQRQYRVYFVRASASDIEDQTLA